MAENSGGWIKTPKQRSLSVKSVTMLAMLVVAFFGWGTAAAGFRTAQDEWTADGKSIDYVSSRGIPRGRGSAAAAAAMIASLIDFGWNSVAQIPSAFSVADYTFRHRIGVPIVVLLVEGLVAAGGYGLWTLERQMEASSPRYPELK